MTVTFQRIHANSPNGVHDSTHWGDDVQVGEHDVPRRNTQEGCHAQGPEAAYLILMLPDAGAYLHECRQTGKAANLAMFFQAGRVRPMRQHLHARA